MTSFTDIHGSCGRGWYTYVDARSSAADITLLALLDALGSRGVGGRDGAGADGRGHAVASGGGSRAGGAGERSEGAGDDDGGETHLGGGGGLF